MTDSKKRKGFLKSQHEALIEIYPDMTRKERREWVKENVPNDIKQRTEICDDK